MDKIPINLFGGELDAIIWNSIATIVVLIYIMSIIKILDILVSKGFPQDISRKIVHIAAGSWVIFWPLYYGNHWSYIFNVAVAFMWTILFIVKGLTATSDDPAVKTMTRTGDPRELLKGPLFFTLVMEFIGIFYFMKLEGVLAMAALGWGDGVAPLFGKYYGRNKYSFLGNQKSIQGSLSMFIFTIIGAFILVSVALDIGVVSRNFIGIIILAVLATVTEAISPKDVDNILIPLVTLVSAFLLF